jgi:hypothetical protein
MLIKFCLPPPSGEDEREMSYIIVFIIFPKGLLKLKGGLGGDETVERNEM